MSVDNDEVSLQKKPFEKDIYDNERKIELAKCMIDPIYFIENYVVVNEPSRGDMLMELFPYQEKIIKGFYEHKKVILMCGRQQGKCLINNTMIKLKSPEGKIYDIKIGDFYEWQEFKKYAKENM